MKSVRVSRGAANGDGLLLAAIAFLLAGGFKWVQWLYKPYWVGAIGGVLLSGCGIWLLWYWIAPKRGKWWLLWEDFQVRITDGDRVEFGGDARDLHLIQEDGRGYLLYPNPNIAYRIRRKDSCPELDALFSKFIRQDS